jgi:TolB-like protein/Tfp pilus assembly protein PilF
VTLPAGTRLGPYEILAPIGAGGMGEVYRARDTRLQREVAIKMPPRELLQNPAALLRFERETRAVAALSHPNILGIHDVGTEGEVTYAVTELLHGETLRHRLASGPLPWPQAVAVATAMANGLAAAHARGVVHRDLKPENVFLTEDGHVKILDFGLARLEAREDREAAPAAAATATETGAILGTVGYMSPEQVKGEKVDARSDIFSLGCVLYEMVTGLRAFTAGNAAETLVAVLREEPTEAAELVPESPEGLGQILRHCLAKDPRDRFQSARDLVLALDDVARGVSLRTGRLPVTRRMPRAAMAAAGVVLAGLVALGVRSILTGRSAINSLAVLPFANASGDPEMDYLSDGIAEGLANSLSRIQSLALPARTSVFAFKGEADPLKAGRALGVKAVLTGRVGKRAGKLVVQADLEDVRRGTHLWGDRYDRSAADLMQVEEEIVEEVTRKLRLRPTRSEQARVLRRATSNPQAYDLYLQGRFHWNKRGEGIARSIELYQRAIELDPNLTLALVGLADSYDLLAFYGIAPPKEVLPKALEAATRALAIDESMAEAHASVADMLYQFEWDWAGAEREFKRAIELNPNYATAHQWYSNYLSVASRFPESFEEIRIARRLDPMNLMIRTDEGLAYHLAGDDERAVSLLHQTIDLEPNFPLAHLYLALSAAKPGAMETSIAESKKAMELMEAEPDPIAFYGYACARGGRGDEALRAHAMLEELAKKRFVSAFPMAVLHVGLGETAQALSALEEAYVERAGRLVYLRVEPVFDALRSEPRFKSLLVKLKIPEPGQTSPSATPAASR